MGPRARGCSWPRAPCGRRELPGARPGRRGRWKGALRAVVATRKPATWVGRSEGGNRWPGGPGGAPGPRRCLKGARVRAAARRVFTFPLVERQCRHLSARARHFRRRGSGSGCGSGVGAGLSHARGAPRSSRPRQRGPHCGARGAPALWLRALADAAALAVGARNAGLRSWPRSGGRWSARAVGSGHCGAPALDKLRVKKMSLHLAFSGGGGAGSDVEGALPSLPV